MDFNLNTAKAELSNNFNLQNVDSVDRNVGSKHKFIETQSDRYFKNRKVEQIQLLDLPDELLASILRYISSIKDINSMHRACKKLDIICKDNLSDLNFSNVSKASKQNLLEFFNKHTLKSCKRVNLLNCNVLHTEIIKTLATKASRLEEINLGSCLSIDEIDLANIITNCKNLSRISINYCNQFDGEVIAFLINNIPSLAYLSFRDNGEGLEEPISASRLKINRVHENLKALDIRGIHISDEALRSIIENCRSLQSLSFGGNYEFKSLKFKENFLSNSEDYPEALKLLRIAYC
jgi:hypothetical protein